jgi:hypothetical protein
MADYVYNDIEMYLEEFRQNQILMKERALRAYFCSLKKRISKDEYIIIINRNINRKYSEYLKSFLENELK